ncbi:MAG: FtsX-like permease family protein [Candidatus Nanopelagicales bacterium]
MFKVALRNLTSHKRRLIGTTSAIVLGVAFLVGTLVLSDTMRASFDQVFSEVNKGIDAAVVSDTPVSDQMSMDAGSVPESLIAKIKADPKVKAVSGEISGVAQIIGKDGKPIGGDGPPAIATNWITEEALNPFNLATGAAPAKSGEIVIDEASSTKADLSVGSKTKLLVPEPFDVTVVGIAKFGSQTSLGGASYAGMYLADAEKLFSFPGQVSQISVQAQDGVSQEELVASIKPLLPEGTKAITGAELTDQQNKEVSEGFLDFFSMFLLVFAIVALVVASFSIYNTFAVIVAQRMRESALLRALGATRGQVLGAQAFEALLVGIIASVVGVVVGLGVAAGLLALLQAAGAGLPSNGLTIGVGSLVAGVIVGIVVTLFASVFPAIHASRVPPLAALRDMAVDRSDTSKVRKYLGGGILVIGLLLAISLVFNSTSALAARVVLACILTFLGYIMFAPVAARPAARVLGWPIAKLRGVPGSMAQRNAMRNPRRTASTSAALLVGVAVVSLFTIFAASIKVSISSGVEDTYTGDFVVSSGGFTGSGFSPELVEQLEKVPGVTDVAAVGFGTVLLDEAQNQVAIANPSSLGSMVNTEAQGVPIQEIPNTSLGISENQAKANNWKVGTNVNVVFADGAKQVMPVASIYESEVLVGPVLLPLATYSEHVRQPMTNMIYIGAQDGANLDQVQQGLQSAVDKSGSGEVQTKAQFVESMTGQIDQLLTIVYALLILAIIIALMGIANTLALSIHERTRELGLLRAVGQTRGQMRAMIRWESVIIAVFGTLGGLGIGLVLGWALMKYIAAEQTVAVVSVPVGQLVAIVVVGAIVGVVAGIRPARRAAKLDVLKAISSD